MSVLGNITVGGPSVGLAFALSTLGHVAAFALIVTALPASTTLIESVITVSFEAALPPVSESVSVVSEQAPSAPPAPREEVVESVPVPKKEAQDIPKKSVVKSRPRSEPSLSRQSRPAPESHEAGNGRVQETPGGSGVADTAPKTYDAKLLGLSAFYPRYARQRGQSGRVVCRVQIDPSGNIVAAAVATSSGFPVLDEAATAALKGARFASATHPHSHEALIAFTFRLED